MRLSSFIIIVLSYVMLLSRFDAREPAVNLYAVSHFKELESLYYRLRINSPPRIELGWKKREIHLKKHICRSIFSSFHFDYQHEMPVEPSHWQIRQELKRTYRSIYNELFFDPDRPSLKMSFPKRRKCLNPWTVHTVELHNNSVLKEKHTFLSENVFMCLVREKQSGEIKKYFISREYNTSETPDVEYIAGRFVFQFGTIDPLHLHALAEQPAYIMTEENVELVYLSMKGDKKRVENVEEDPVCRLNNGEKYRLCSIILYSSMYRKSVKFWPGSSSIGFDCKQKAIKFQTEEAKQRATSGIIYKEWVISCHAISWYGRNNFWRTYYISRGYSSKNAFIYKFSRGNLVLDRRGIEVKLLRDDD